MALDGSSQSVIVFDSHAHGTAGALLAKVDVVNASSYLEAFFAKYYPQTKFHPQIGPNLAAHFNVVEIKG